MTLLSLYHRHADVCLQMAASSKNTEIKERWLELANHWRQKADDSEGLTDTAAEPSPQPLSAVTASDISGEGNISGAATTEPPASQDVMIAPNTLAPSLTPSPDEVSNPQLQIQADDDVPPPLSPSLHEGAGPQLREADDVTPSLSPSLHEGPNLQPQIEAGDDVPPVIELDDDWKKILADIRRR